MVRFWEPLGSKLPFPVGAYGKVCLVCSRPSSQPDMMAVPEAAINPASSLELKKPQSLHHTLFSLFGYGATLSRANAQHIH
jgi:hypothetical protein